MELQARAESQVLINAVIGQVKLSPNHMSGSATNQEFTPPLTALSGLASQLRCLLYLMSPACFSRSTWIAANRPSVVMQSRPGSASQKGQRILLGLTVRVRERFISSSCRTVPV